MFTMANTVKKVVKKTNYFQLKRKENRGSVYISDNDHKNHPEEVQTASVLSNVKEKIYYLRSNKKKYIKKI